MKISYNWLQTYFDKELPSPEEIEEVLTFHAFEIEGIEKVGNDSVINVDVLPNRAHDCLSHRGIAKELSVLLETPLKRDVLREDPKEIGKELPKSELLSVEIDDTLLCRRYTSVFIKGVKVGPSPQWLKERIEAIGQKSINNIVDATNYVMFNLGQPLHAFDASKLEKKDDKYSIVVRKAKDKEKIVVLTGEEYELTGEDLLIVDGNSDSPIGIAGIKGGKAAEVDESTTNIIIESANFHPVNTRKTSQSLKLRTDASTRFENELAPEMALYGLLESVALIQELAGGEVEGYIDEYPLQKNTKYKIGVSTQEINKLLGTNISDKEVENIFSRFGFSYEKVNPVDKILELAPTFKGKPYKYGASISYDAPYTFDCSSFVGYVYAQAGVALPRIAIDQYVYGVDIKKEDLKSGDLVFSTNGDSGKENKFKRITDDVEVVHVGAMEVSQEFLSGTKVEGGVSHCGIYIGEGIVIHASSTMGITTEKIEKSGYFNKIVGYRRVTDGKERYVVTIPFERLDLHAHTSFLTSGNKEDLIEEIGRVYGYENIGEEVPKKDKDVNINKKYYYIEKIRDFLTKNNFTEVYTYSLRDTGDLEIINPIASDKNFMRATLMDGVKDSIELNEKNKAVLGQEEINIFEVGNIFPKSIEHTSVCIGTSNKKANENIVEKLFNDLDVDISGKWVDSIYKFNLDKILNLLEEPKEYDVESEDKMFLYKPFSLFPSTFRDIAVWVPEDKTSEDILSMIVREAGGLLIQSNLFDEYKKDVRVSYAFKLVFQSQEKTLTDEEVNEIVNKITNNLNSQEGFEVR